MIPLITFFLLNTIQQTATIENTTAKVAWNTSNDNTDGMNEIITALENDTDSWHESLTLDSDNYYDNYQCTYMIWSLGKSSPQKCQHPQQFDQKNILYHRLLLYALLFSTMRISHEDISKLGSQEIGL